VGGLLLLLSPLLFTQMRLLPLWCEINMPQRTASGSLKTVVSLTGHNACLLCNAKFAC
jgi:hypothetical protein